MNKFVIQRLFAGGVVYLVNIYLARYYGLEHYGQVAYQIFIAKFFLILNMGSISGYLYKFYKPSSENIITPSSFLFFYSIQLVLLSILLLFMAYYFELSIFWGLVFFICIIPLYVVEPVLRIKRVFWVSLMPELTLTLCIFIMTFFYDSSEITNSDTYIGTALLLVLSSLLVFAFSSRVINFKKSSSKLTLVNKFTEYVSIIKNGMPLYIGSGMFLVYLFIDRFFIERHFSGAFLSAYMFAFQLAIISSFIISSMNFVYAVDIGEKFRDKTLSYDEFFKKFKQIIFIGFMAYIFIIIVSFLIQKYILTEYENLTLLTAILSFGIVLFFCSGNLSPILFYANKLNPFIILLSVIVLLMCVVNITVHLVGASPLYVIGISTALLSVYSILIIKSSMREINLHDQKLIDKQL